GDRPADQAAPVEARVRAPLLHDERESGAVAGGPAGRGIDQPGRAAAVLADDLHGERIADRAPGRGDHDPRLVGDAVAEQPGQHLRPPTLLAALATAPAVPAHATAAPAPRWVDIPARDGVVLKANVVEPATPGRHPAVVFISSWGLNDTEYLAEASTLAGRG